MSFSVAVLVLVFAVVLILAAAPNPALADGEADEEADGEAAGEAAAPAVGAARPAYPPTRREDILEEMHGERVADPYRWLEEDDAAEVEAWDQAQEVLLRSHLDPVPERAALRRRLDEELGLGAIPSLPGFRAGRRWYTRLLPGQNQPVLYAAEESGANPVPVLDPHPWSSDGTEAFKGWAVSPDGRHVAYERSVGGSEDTTVFVRDVAAGKDLSDRLPRTKFTSLEWSQDGTGFYYSQKPPPDAVPAGEAPFHSRIRFHRLGTLALDDPIVFGAGRAALETYGVHRSRDERHLLVSGGIPYESIDTYDLEEVDGRRVFTPVVVGHDSRTHVDRVGDLYLLVTDDKAPRRRLCVARRGETNDPARWKEILPQQEGVLEDAVAVGERILVHVRTDAISRLFVIGFDGSRQGEIRLPGPGTVGEWLSTKPDDTRVWFAYESYDVPLTTYVVDLAAQGWPLVAEHRTPTTIDTSAFTTTQTTYRSKDGTEIPLFLVHRKDAPPDGTRPTVLYGYGGFRVGLYPRFSRARALWVERGGVWAFACLRGGDERGESWHEAGYRGAKQNVFDDFIAAADWLVATKRASRERLAIWGGSNGGLLVSAVANQRPDLCRALICSVPLTDMLRYHRFQYAKMWAAEYGNPDEPEAFGWIRPYSPYHNVRDGVAYPAALVTAGLNDSRVNAFHARKIVARWQEATSSDRPILLALDRKGGHGAAGLDRLKAEILDHYCFLVDQIGP